MARGHASGGCRSPPGGERSGTFVWLVPVVEEEDGHESDPGLKAAPVHRGEP